MSEPHRPRRGLSESDVVRPARCTVYGVGRWGTRVASTLIAGGHDVVLVSSGGADRRASLSARFGTRVMADVSAAVDAGHTDGVFVCTPGPLHADHVAAALALGVDVFVEKPMTVSPATARAVVDASQRAGRRVFVDHTWLFSEACIAIAALASADPVIHVRATWVRPVPLSLNLIWELLPHPASVTLALLGPAADLEADGTKDAFEFTLQSAGGGRAELAVRRGTARPVELAIKLASGRTIEWRDRRATLAPEGLVLAAGDDDPLHAAIAAFLSGGTTAHSGAGFGASVVDLVDVSDRAARSSHPIQREVG